MTETPAAPWDADERGFGIYVHWPFCRAKCPYCDFNSHVREAIDQSRWRAALLAELAHYAAQTPGRTVTSVFFGGGTPSLMEPETTAARDRSGAAHWATAPDLEITLEANPTSVEIERFRGFRDAGVNRVSIGVQALDDAGAEIPRPPAQRRRGDPRAGNRPRDRFRGSPSISSMRGRVRASKPGSNELSTALDLANSHISLYQLTIEPGTAFEQRVARGDFQTLPEEEQAALFDWTTARLELPACRPTRSPTMPARAKSRGTTSPIGATAITIGIGPGAHGRLTLDGQKARDAATPRAGSLARRRRTRRPCDAATGWRSSGRRGCRKW